MRKKSFISAVAAAVLGLASCQQQAEVVRPVQTGETSVVTITVEGEATKAQGITPAQEGEGGVPKSFQVFVFADGTQASAPEIEKYVENANTVDISLTGGNKTIVVLANCGRQDNVTSATDLQGRVLTLGTSVAASGLPMYASKTVNIESGVGVTKDQSGKITVSMSLRRQVARVEISKVSNNLASSAYSSKPFAITGIYLVRANGSQSVSGMSKATWNENGKSGAGAASDYVTSQFSSSGVTVSLGGSYNTPNTFYPFGWSDASVKTLLCVEVKVEGEPTWYYPIDIAKKIPSGNKWLEANKKYTITELNITRPGNLTPTNPIETEGASFELSVESWGNGLSTSVDF